VKAASIKRYLKASTIMSRKSTFTNAFASALAPYDAYSAEAVAGAMRDLGQDPDEELVCVYCGAPAATWDHLFNRVSGGEFSGHGHRIRNLVPCCRTCNERKGQKPWLEWLNALDPQDKELRVQRIENFLARARKELLVPSETRHHAERELKRFLEIRSQVFESMKEADALAAVIRDGSVR
jgi:HNH endonuclease